MEIETKIVIGACITVAIVFMTAILTYHYRAIAAMELGYQETTVVGRSDFVWQRP